MSISSTMTPESLNSTDSHVVVLESDVVVSVEAEEECAALVVLVAVLVLIVEDSLELELSESDDISGCSSTNGSKISGCMHAREGNTFHEHKK